MENAVCALIRKRNLVLGVSRKDDPTDFGLPGGRVDPGETLEEAVYREVFEETGLLVTSIEKVLYEAEDNGYHCTTYLVTTEGFIDHELEAGVVKWVKPDVLEAGTFGAYNKALFERYPIPRKRDEITPERQQEIRSIIRKLRVADETDEIAPRLYTDAQYALLDLLDRVKVVGPYSGD